MNTIRRWWLEYGLGLVGGEDEVCGVQFVGYRCFLLMSVLSLGLPKKNKSFKLLIFKFSTMITSDF